MRQLNEGRALLVKCFTNKAFTLLELLIAVAAMALLMAIAVPSYQSYRDKLNINKSKGDISNISLIVTRFFVKLNRYPDNLAEIGMDQLLDPWGRPYYYMNIANQEKVKGARKDRFLHPVNNDFDLYSVGKNGLTKLNLNNPQSDDDVIRANSGGFVGLAKDY